MFLPYIHAISKKFKTPVSLLAKDNSKAKDIFEEDNHVNEIIILENRMDGVSGIIRLTKEFQKRNFDKIFQDIQKERIKAFKKYQADVKFKKFPSKKHSVLADQKELIKFKKLITDYNNGNK